MVFRFRINYNIVMKKFLILLFLSFSFSGPAFADKAFDLWNADSYEEAIIEWTKLAYGGQAIAQNNLGVVYSSGKKIKKDCNKAIFWFKKGVQQNYAESEYNLGEEYISGNCTRIDNKEGIRLITKSAEQGYSSAQYYLGNLYDAGIKIPKSDELSYRWYLKAASQGHEKSQYNLGITYQYGDNFIKKDYTSAFKWYQKAANKKYGKAYYKMGFMYENGYGVVINPIFAKNWYTRASQAGITDANSALNRLKLAKVERKKKADAEEKIKADAEKKRQDEIKRRKIEREKIQAKNDLIKAEKKKTQMIQGAAVVVFFLAIWLISYLMKRGPKQEAERRRIKDLKRIALREKKEQEEEELRLHQLAVKEEEERIYTLQQKKLVYLKADKYLAEFESHLPFKLSANYSDLRVFYDEDSSKTQSSFIENETSFKDGRLWNALISLLQDDHSLDTMSTVYFAKIRSLLDDENYLVIGETDLDINEFFDRSTQLELVDLISSSLMPKPIALFVILHLSREFRYPNEEERAETEFKLEHFIIKENSKVKVQKLFTKLDEYAIKCVNSYADVSLKDYFELESKSEGFIKEEELKED